MIDFENERIVSLREAASLPMLRKGGSAPKTTSTLSRWIKQGLRGIRLESVFRGGERVTSVEALHRFFERVTAARDGQAAIPPPRTPTQRQRASERAARLCESKGF